MKFDTTSIRALALGVGVLVALPSCLDVQGDEEVETGKAAQALGFDWGGDCSSGAGDFSQSIAYQQTTSVGDIPPNKRDVYIELNSSSDVDVQLIDKSTGHKIIAWPSGDLNGAGNECTTYYGVEYCYSGYNGVDGNWGHEWIEIRGVSNRALEMRAYGYQAGNAEIDYTWKAATTCSEKGSGSFQQFIAYYAITDIGTIPSNKVNVEINLTAANDIDIQLYDGNTAIVKWPDGLMNGPNEQSISYEGMNIVWSGYNGNGTGLGNEFIRIDGRVTRALTMKVFGYASGNALVEYSWGGGAGAACGSQTLPPCAPGLLCKNGDSGNIAVDIPGTCHTEFWCESKTSAASDCANLAHIMIPGNWGCTNEFTCKWVSDFPAQACSLYGTQCPNGQTCEWDCEGMGGNCGINPSGYCRVECTAANDCPTGDYCAEAGVCRDNGVCMVDADCAVAENLWQQLYCTADSITTNICNQDKECQTVCQPILVPNLCVDVSTLDLGLCEMFLGWGYDSTIDDCRGVSGCGAQGNIFHANKQDCVDMCG